MKVDKLNAVALRDVSVGVVVGSNRVLLTGAVLSECRREIIVQFSELGFVGICVGTECIRIVRESRAQSGVNDFNLCSVGNRVKPTVRVVLNFAVAVVISMIVMVISIIVMVISMLWSSP